MTEETIYVTPTAIFRAGRVALEAATVDSEEKGRALLVFRSEQEANDYRRTKGVFPKEEGFKSVTLSAKMLRDVLEMHGCTHVVTPVSLVGDEEPDFFAAEDFLGILEEFPPVEVA